MFRTGGEKSGAASSIQLLLTNLVERVHDAVWVLPRHSAERYQASLQRVDATDTTPSLPDINLDEYAIDMAFSLKRLRQEAQCLPQRKPGMYLETQARLNELKLVADDLDQQIRVKLQESHSIMNRLDSTIRHS